MDITELDFAKGDGLIPAIVQDADTFQVLMLGYMNREALEKTLRDKRVTFYSRSKERLWTKGESSENYLNLVDIQQDCDRDTLLILADPEGPTCHTGDTSCFHEKEFKPAESGYHFLHRLDQLIAERKAEMPEGSYTTSLFEDGIDTMAQKVGEEAVETAIEAKNSDEKAFLGEAADLLYHLMVLLAGKGNTLRDVIARLKSRHR